MTRNDFGRAYVSGFKPTVKFLASRGVPPDSAEETAQAAWVKGWESRDQLRNEAVIRTWVNTIALHMYRRAARKAGRNQPLVDEFAGTPLNVAAIDIAQVLDCCGASDRALLTHQLQGLTTSEIARAVGVSETAVRIRLTRARQAARSRLHNATNRRVTRWAVPLA